MTEKQQSASDQEVWDYIKARCDRLAKFGIKIDTPSPDEFTVTISEGGFRTRLAALKYAEEMAQKLGFE